MIRVSRVLPASIAEEIGIVPSTELRSVNGRELGDFLDWEFLTTDEEPSYDFGDVLESEGAPSMAVSR